MKKINFIIEGVRFRYTPKYSRTAKEKQKRNREKKILKFSKKNDRLYDRLHNTVTRYHQTGSKKVDSILDNGLLGSYASKPGTDSYIFNRDNPNAKNLLYMMNSNRYGAPVFAMGDEPVKLRIRIPKRVYYKKERITDPIYKGAVNYKSYLRNLITDTITNNKGNAKDYELIMNRLNDYGYLKDKNSAIDRFVDWAYKNTPKRYRSFEGDPRLITVIRGNIEPQYIERSKKFKEEPISADRLSQVVNSKKLRRRLYSRAKFKSRR